jgi:hypothetical protein
MLVVSALTPRPSAPTIARYFPNRSGSLAGVLAGKPVAEHAAFREIRTLLSASIARGRRGGDTPE